jgi:hypothetical protein
MRYHSGVSGCIFTYESREVPININQGSEEMEDQLPGLRDHSYYEPLFEPITLKLRQTGGMDLEILIGELLPSVLSRYDGDDIEEAVMLLEIKGIIRCEALDGETFVEIVE